MINTSQPWVWNKSSICSSSTFYSSFAIHFLFFGQEVKATLRPTQTQVMTDSGYLTAGTLNLGSNQSDDDGGQILFCGTALFGSPLAEDKSFIMVDLALLHLRIIFIGTFFTPGQNTSFLVIITVFSSHVKMVLSKTNTSLMIYSIPNYILCSKILLPEWCLLKT